MMTDWVRQALGPVWSGGLPCVTKGRRQPSGPFCSRVTSRENRCRIPPTALGWMDGRQWQYLGQEPLETGDTLTWKDMTFRVRSCRPYYIGEALSPLLGGAGKGTGGGGMRELTQVRDAVIGRPDGGGTAGYGGLSGGGGPAV